MITKKDWKRYCSAVNSAVHARVLSVKVFVKGVRVDQVRTEEKNCVDHIWGELSDKNSRTVFKHPDSLTNYTTPLQLYDATTVEMSLRDYIKLRNAKFNNA